MSNPFFYIDAGATTPTLDVALFDGNGDVVDNLQGATVEFQLLDLGATQRFRRAATVLDEDEGKVRYAWQAGDIPSTVGVHLLGRFWVTYSNLDVQGFPSNRYIEIITT